MSETFDVYKEAREELLDGHSGDPTYYMHFMDDPDGVVDSVILSIEDNVGTPSRRSTAALHNKYEKVSGGDPVLTEKRKYGRALKILDELGFLDHLPKQSRWRFVDPDTDRLEEVKRAAHHPEVRSKYE